MNPWDAVEQLRFQYEQRIDEELRAQEAFLASKDEDEESKRNEWRASMERKAVAYLAYRHAVGEAMKSVIPCPW